jgi:putative endonuclease
MTPVPRRALPAEPVPGTRQPQPCRWVRPHYRAMNEPVSGRSLGAQGELAALAHYRRSGYRLVARNWRCPLGELDLVLARGRTVVFCEVKTRRSATLGGPYEAVTWRKQGKLRALANAFLAMHPARWDDVRFDVASVMVDRRGPLSVHVFEAAF